MLLRYSNPLKAATVLRSVGASIFFVTRPGKTGTRLVPYW